MNLIALANGDPVTWGDVLLILAVIALVVFIAAFIPRFRR